jgi:hypothetical protein
MNFMRKYLLMFIILGTITEGFGQDKKKYLNFQF